MMSRVKTVYSHSRLSCFENCPKQFHYRYVQRITVDTESIEGFVGKLVHSVIEKLNVTAAANRIPSLEAVLRRYQIMWEEGFDPERTRIVRQGQSPEHYRKMGEQCTEHFYRTHYPFDADETLGIEQNVTFNLDTDGRYRIRGVIDRIARKPDGVVEIQDYKTGQRVPSQAILDRDRQLALYQMAMSERLGDGSEMRLVWLYLARRRVCTSQRTPDQLARLRDQTMDLIDQIEAKQDFEASTGPLCRWCEYNDRCPTGREFLGDDAPPAAPPSPEPAPRTTEPAPVSPTAEGPAGDQLTLFS